MDSLCHPWVTTTNPSYRLPIFETSATALCGTTGMKRTDMRLKETKGMERNGMNWDELNWMRWKERKGKIEWHEVECSDAKWNDMRWNNMKLNEVKGMDKWMRWWPVLKRFDNDPYLLAIDHFSSPVFQLLLQAKAEDLEIVRILLKMTLGVSPQIENRCPTLTMVNFACVFFPGFYTIISGRRLKFFKLCSYNPSYK